MAKSKAQAVLFEAVQNQKQIRISQSLMKDVRGYLDGGSCGVLIREKWIKGRLLGVPSDAMELGMYFEYVLTGSVPKDGKVPEPRYMLSKIKANKGSTVGLGPDDMYEAYRSVHENVAVVNQYLAGMGLRIYNALNGGLAAGVKITKGRFEGLIDVILEAERDTEFDSGLKIKKGQLIVVDIKYSGLLEDKWNVHGWQWTPEQKKYHGTQAKHYFMLVNAKFAGDKLVWEHNPPIPFMFLVVDPGGKYVKIFHCQIDESAVMRHVEEGNALHDKLMYLFEMDLLEARPEVNKCAGCPLNMECAFKHTFPHPVNVDLTVD
jgi:hypothetical protein